MATAAELLAAVETEILWLITNGQENRFSDKLNRRVTLDELRAMRKELKAEVAQSSSGTDIFSRARVGIPYRG